MKVKELIAFLETFDKDLEIIFQDYNWNVFSANRATGNDNGKSQPVIVVFPQDNEEEED